MIKNNIKLFIGIIIGIVIGSVGVYALSINSKDVSYDNVTSGAEATNVQDALDELYETIENGSKVYSLGTGISFDLKTLHPEIDYTKLTADNFIVGTTSASQTSAGYTSRNQYTSSSARFTGFSITKTYDNATGILTISGNNYSVSTCIDSSQSYCADNRTYGSVTPYAYLVIGDIN